MVGIFCFTEYCDDDDATKHVITSTKVMSPRCRQAMI